MADSHAKKKADDFIRLYYPSLPHSLVFNDEDDTPERPGSPSENGEITSHSARYTCNDRECPAYRGIFDELDKSRLLKLPSRLLRTGINDITVEKDLDRKMKDVDCYVVSCRAGEKYEIIYVYIPHRIDLYIQHCMRLHILTGSQLDIIRKIFLCQQFLIASSNFHKHRTKSDALLYENAALRRENDRLRERIKDTEDKCVEAIEKISKIIPSFKRKHALSDAREKRRKIEREDR